MVGRILSTVAITAVNALVLVIVTRKVNEYMDDRRHRKVSSRYRRVLPAKP